MEIALLQVPLNWGAVFRYIDIGICLCTVHDRHLKCAHKFFFPGFYCSCLWYFFFLALQVWHP